jgi:hypothetical protein
VAELGERLEVASRPAAEIEDRERWVALDGSQQRFDVLADVVIARAFPEVLGMPVVVFQREAGDFFQVLRQQRLRDRADTVTTRRPLATSTSFRFMDASRRVAVGSSYCHCAGHRAP